jgi:hypothetical protein
MSNVLPGARCAFTLRPNWLTRCTACPATLQYEDKSGYNKYGYDKYGYTKDGYDKYGYDKYGEFSTLQSVQHACKVWFRTAALLIIEDTCCA